MSKSKIQAALIRHLLNEGYDSKFVRDLVLKWKSENVSVKDGLIKLMEEYKKTHNSITSHHHQASSHHHQA